MMNKYIKYAIWAIIALLALYKSVYFQPLDERLAESKVVEFDAESFVNGIWTRDLNNAFAISTDISELLLNLQKNPENTFEKEGQALGIGNINYFKVSGEGEVRQVNDNNVILEVDGKLVEIETEFIFGNAIRDASGLIKINDYSETSDFNAISEAINSKIRKEIIPEFRKNIVKGDRVSFRGAIELNRAHLNLDRPEVIPIQLQINS